jgi:Zn-dependent protease with chaperone function
MAGASLYPPSPIGVPADLVEPSSGYKTQIVLVLAALAAFFILYFGILAGCVAFFAWTFASVLLIVVSPAFAVLTLFQLVLCVPVFLLFVYMLKNLFRWGSKEKTDHVEIFAHQHPDLFDFIYRICDETGAPYPKRVFVNYAVNAAAFSNGNSFWHLFFPTRKNLLLGLGLVNALNLTEFKALLAHEFGHFAQKSTKLGAYTYTALGIMNQIVDGYDFIDRLIDEWRSIEHPIAIPAMVFYGILWSLRHALMGLRYVTFYFDQGLSRQMEFNADLVAVSVTGSDAPVHLLFRSSFAERCLNQSILDMRAAMDHDLCTEDMFFHQSHAVEYIRRRERKPQMGEPPALPADVSLTTRVFEPDDDERGTMWSTHPANYDRETNAKAHYIRSEFDERSPWLLFDDALELRADVTYKFYRVHLKADKDIDLADATEFQFFIDEERAETTYHPSYQGLYDFRYLVLEEIYVLAEQARAASWSMLRLSQTHADLYNVEVRHRGQVHNKRLEEQKMLLAISQGGERPKNNEIKFRDKVYKPAEAKRLLRRVKKELDKDRPWLGELDRQVFSTFYQMAIHLEGGVAQELFDRYRFHLDLQSVCKNLRSQDSPVGAAVSFLSNLRTVRIDREYFDAALSIFRDAHHALRDSLVYAEDMPVPELKNMRAGEPLRKFLLEKRLVEGVTASTPRASAGCSPCRSGLARNASNAGPIPRPRSSFRHNHEFQGPGI